MKMEITNEKQNPLQKRNEIVFEITDFKTTPSRKEVAAQLASKKGVEAGAIVIEKLHNSYGATHVHGNARIYPNAAEAQQKEPKHLMERTAGKTKTEAK